MFEELKFNRSFRRPKEVYKRDINKSVSVAKEVENKNPSFSETFFDTWIRTIFLRYAAVISLEGEKKIEEFEKIHFKEGVKNNWRDEMELYKYFDEVFVNFVDFIEYIRTDEVDVLNLKLSVTGSLKKKKNNEDEIKDQVSSIYTIELEKPVSKNEKNKSKDTIFTSNCPNCGGPNSFVTFGTCRYCGDFICIYDNEWKIRKINLER